MLKDEKEMNEIMSLKLLKLHLRVFVAQWYFYFRMNGFWAHGRWFFGGLSRKEGAYLYKLVRELKPEFVVETGIQNGSSSLYVLQALKDNGRGTLLSVDFPEWAHTINMDYRNPFKPCNSVTLTGALPGWIVPKRLCGRWKRVFGRSDEKLKVLLEEVRGKGGKVGLFMHDSDHSYDNILFELELANSYMDSGGVFVVDDFKRNNASRDFARLHEYKFEVVDGFGVIKK